MTNEQAEALGTTQQVLRHLMLAMAVATRADRAVLSDALAAASTNGSITAEARLALANLADCACGIPGISADSAVKVGEHVMQPCGPAGH